MLQKYRGGRQLTHLTRARRLPQQCAQNTWPQCLACKCYNNELHAGMQKQCLQWCLRTRNEKSVLQPLHQNTALSCTQRGPRSFFTAVPRLALNRTIQTPIHNPQTTNQKPKTTNHKPQIANREQQTTNHKPGIIQRWQGRVHTRKILGIGMAVGVRYRDVSWLFLSCATREPQGQAAATGAACAPSCGGSQARANVRQKRMR